METFEEKVGSLKREVISPFGNAYFQMGESWGETPSTKMDRGSFFCLRNAILAGEIAWIEKNLPYFANQLAICKEAFKLYSKYNGYKTLYNASYSTQCIIYLNRGVLYMDSSIIEKNLLTWDRLIKHALVRAKKHPRYS